MNRQHERSCEGGGTIEAEVLGVGLGSEELHASGDGHARRRRISVQISGGKALHGGKGTD
jgi:hypothetical protein